MFPTVGGSAFFGRAKNDGKFRKTHLRLPKTAQSPQVVGVAGPALAGFFCYFFLGKQKKVRMLAVGTNRAYSTIKATQGWLGFT